MTTQSEPWLEYLETHSEEAFARVVKDHVQVVYSAALRKSRGDTHLAEEIAQVVFTEIARRPELVPRDASLAGWLYRHTCFRACQTIRDQSRKRQREESAVKMVALDVQSEDPWEVVSPLLDDLMADLKDGERDALVLRFLEGLDLRSVGLSMGISEDAAQKKVSRALDSLRGLFMQRGISITAAVLAVSLESNARAQIPTVFIAALARIAAGTVAKQPFITTTVATAMKTKQILIGALLLAGTMSVMLIKQQSTIGSLKDQRVVAERLASEKIGAAQRKLSAVSPVVTSSMGDAVRAEHLELMRLRAEVSHLRAQQRAISANNASEQSAGNTNSLVTILKVLWDKGNTSAADSRRSDAALQLRNLGSEAALGLPSFRELLHSENYITKVAGARALAYTSEASSEAFQDLTNALSDPDAEVRKAAAHGLGHLFSLNSTKVDVDSTIPRLVQNLRDADDGVRHDTAAVLMVYRQTQEWVGKSGQPALVVPALTESLGDSDYYARGNAVRALAEYGVDAISALPQLTTLREDSDSDVRAAAEDALKRISKKRAAQEAK